ncbi:YajG family lipoprotein [Henriciella litoralis]|uniref:hypothetical protein n=1 Tax=Henriciella litoralis TaxID=568102 RepID=UPI000A075156|nr:hypothetical protein [Henriciella litoralis]
MIRNSLFAIACALMATACASSRPVTLAYDTTSVQPYEGSKTVAMGTVIDERGNGTNWLGAIRGGYGNPLKVLETDEPVNNVVADLILEGMKARGMAGSNAKSPFELNFIINTLSSSQYARREAHADIIGILTDRDAGKPVYTAQGTADNVDGSALSMKTGVFADPEELRALLNTTLQQAIDNLLDDPGLRAALK